MTKNSATRLGFGSFAFWLLLLVTVAPGCGGSGSMPPLASIPGPAPELKVGTIRPGDTGWIRLTDLFIDDNGIAWVDADATVYRKSDTGLASLPPMERAFIGTASGYLHVSMSRDVNAMTVVRTSPRDAHWLPARNLGAVVQAIRGGYQDVALPRDSAAKQETPGS